MKIKVLPRLNSKAETPNFGAKIKQARIDCGLSQIELAREIGLESATGISLMEDEQRRISVKALNQIAHVTNKPISFFFEITPTTKEK